MKPRLLALVTATLLAIAAWAQNTPPTLSLELEKPQAVAGELVKGTVVLTFAEGLHGYQNPPSEDYMIPVQVKAGEGTTLSKVDYPKGTNEAVGGSAEPVLVYSGETRIPVEIVAPKETGEHRVVLDVKFQQCDATSCFPPKTIQAKAALAVTAGGAGSETPVTAPTNPVPGEQPPADAPPVAEPHGSGLAGWLQENFRQRNFLFIVLGAMIVGLALCLTPCVYPMIPITVSYFSNQSATNRGAKIGLGLSYAMGIALTYGAVGAIFAALGKGVGALFTMPWFLFALSALMVVLALSMFDVYEIGIPPFIGKHLKGRSGPTGALIMGLLMGFAAAPCAGALVSAVAIEVANTQNLGIGLLVFTSIGLGLGLPFIVLAAVSTGASKVLPKSGGWLKAVKSVLGLVVLWLAVDYLFKGLGMKPDDPRTLLGWVAAYGLAAAYLLFFEKEQPTKLVMGIKGVALLALGLMAGTALEARSQALFNEELRQLGNPGAISVNWQPYNAETFAKAKESGKPIFIDVTADWCVKCQETDKNVFRTPQGIAALNEVVALKIDHSTGVDPAYIDATTKEFNIVGLPHFMTFKPGGEKLDTRFEIHNVEELKTLLRKAGAKL
ncbi:MAG: thioredoxin family protein [Fimbriimonadaceae bacterium]|nr:thioredoxin family protein [Fimbriimonadaceae bacterium]QYK54807.1 MAG: thioredoxin family protein [Fimbriimonadaceae bacterium]